MCLNRISHIATRRHHSIFAEELSKLREAFAERLGGKDVLVVGGAGSIGSSTINCLLEYPLQSLTIVDQDENGLARLMRAVRGRAEQPSFPIFAECINLGGPVFSAMLEDRSPFAYVFNFAAVKHVRSEKSVYSLLHMIETNVLYMHHLKKGVRRASPQSTLFSVSSDKAVNPTSFMGLTKRTMEHVLLAGSDDFGGEVKTARFANVAFSSGSLLESFVDRMASDIPLSVPSNIKRYFISMEEAGQLCMLSAVFGKDLTITIPNLEPGDHLVDLVQVAERYVNKQGLDPIRFTLDEAEKAKEAVHELRRKGCYPLVITPPNTKGEKGFEEFYSEFESPYSTRYSNRLLEISYEEAPGSIDQFIDQMSSLITGDGGCYSFEQIANIFRSLEPNCLSMHIDGEQLDDRL